MFVPTTPTSISGTPTPRLSIRIRITVGALWKTAKRPFAIDLIAVIGTGWKELGLALIERSGCSRGWPRARRSLRIVGVVDARGHVLADGNTVLLHLGDHLLVAHDDERPGLAVALRRREAAHLEDAADHELRDLPALELADAAARQDGLLDVVPVRARLDVGDLSAPARSACGRARLRLALEVFEVSRSRVSLIVILRMPDASCPRPTRRRGVLGRRRPDSRCRRPGARRAPTCRKLRRPRP